MYVPEVLVHLLNLMTRVVNLFIVTNLVCSYILDLLTFCLIYDDTIICIIDHLASNSIGTGEGRP